MAIINIRRFSDCCYVEVLDNGLIHAYKTPNLSNVEIIKYINAIKKGEWNARGFGLWFLCWYCR